MNKRDIKKAITELRKADAAQDEAFSLLCTATEKHNAANRYCEECKEALVALLPGNGVPVIHRGKVYSVEAERLFVRVAVEVK